MESYFRTWELSLYKIPHERIEHLRTQGFEDDMYIDEANHTAAVLLLKKENIQSAERFIEYAISKDETSIHAWCNKGLYHMMEFPPRIQEAEKAKMEMETLKQKEGPMKAARVEYAFWLFNKDRTEGAKRQALQMMEADLGDGREQNEPSHHYLYAKALVTAAKYPGKVDDRHLSEILTKLVDQLTMLAMSHDPKFELEMWVFLADVQNNPHCKRLLGNRAIDLSKLLGVSGSGGADVETCVQQIEHLINHNTELQVKSNFYARVSDVLMNVAINKTDRQEKKDLLEKALEICESADTTPSCNDKRPIICARILLNLWALEYWQSHRNEAESAFREYSEGKALHPDKIQRFLALEYYGTNVDGEYTGQLLLKKARKYLNQCVEQRGDFHPEYPRVLMLLGETPDVLEGVFNHAYQSAEFDHDRVRILLNHGRFLEAIKRDAEALKRYSDAKVLRDSLLESGSHVVHHSTQIDICLERVQRKLV